MSLHHYLMKIASKLKALSFFCEIVGFVCVFVVCKAYIFVVSL